MCRRDVLEVMERLRKHTAIFYSTHILEDVQRVSDTVAILKDGELIAEAPIGELLAGSSSSTTYAVELKGDVDGARARVVVQPWVASVSIGARNGTTRLDIAVTDETAADTQLLQLITAERGVTVSEFGRKSKTWKRCSSISWKEIRVMVANAITLNARAESATPLRRVQPGGWRSGLGNLLRNELRPWISTRFGLIQVAIWLVVINGFLALPLWIAPLLDHSERADIEQHGGPYELGILCSFSWRRILPASA